MHEKSLSEITARYFKRFGFQERLIEEKPPSDMKISLVIPCYNETGLCDTLDSLAQCYPPQCPVEVLIIINSGWHDTEQVKLRNSQTYSEIDLWKKANEKHWLKIRVVTANDLPPKHAGVGLARKIGMDEALRRFASIHYCGMIVCLDADCLVEANYLQVLEEVQVKHFPRSCTIHFEHDMQQVNDPVLREGIMHYELFLRYYVNALGYSGYPFAMHTIGSSMAVRADVYALSGGMNRRKAGEDFYFLHKVVPLGGFFSIQNTTVYPSARLSDRVPFGTGKAQQDWLEDKEKRNYTYHPRTFEDLREMTGSIRYFYEADSIDRALDKIALPESVRHFLHQQGFTEKLKEMKENSSGYPTFIKRFFSWFDGFKALKFVHYCRDYYYKEEQLCSASQQLLKKLGLHNSAEVSELLQAYRSFDKSRNSLNLILT